MNQEFEDWLSLWILIGLCLLLHANRKIEEERDKGTACVKIDIPLTWGPVASDARASLRLHLLLRPSYFRAQLRVYRLRDPGVIFQVSVGSIVARRLQWLKQFSRDLTTSPTCCYDLNREEITKSWRRYEVRRLRETAAAKTGESAETDKGSKSKNNYLKSKMYWER